MNIPMNQNRKETHQSTIFTDKQYMEIKTLTEQAMGLLHEGMMASGTSTLHYHKMDDALECLCKIAKTLNGFGHRAYQYGENPTEEQMRNRERDLGWTRDKEQP